MLIISFGKFLNEIKSNAIVCRLRAVCLNLRSIIHQKIILSNQKFDATRSSERRSYFLMPKIVAEKVAA